MVRHQEDGIKGCGLPVDTVYRTTNEYLDQWKSAGAAERNLTGVLGLDQLFGLQQGLSSLNCGVDSEIVAI